MVFILLWMVIYSIVVAASIIFIGKPIAGELAAKSLFMLLFDWRFLLGGILALGARFIFVIINNLASKEAALANAHLTIAALATQLSILAIIAANIIFLNERLSLTQIIGAAVILIGVFLVLK